MSLLYNNFGEEHYINNNGNYINSRNRRYCHYLKENNLKQNNEIKFNNIYHNFDNINDLRTYLEKYENILINLLSQRINYSPEPILNDNYIIHTYNELIIPYCTGKEKCPIELEQGIIDVMNHRISYGDKVMQIKYNENKNKFNMLKIDDEIINELTNKSVEREILNRVIEKANKTKFDSYIIFKLYRNIIIPKTIERELFYFKNSIKNI